MLGLWQPCHVPSARGVWLLGVMQEIRRKIGLLSRDSQSSEQFAGLNRRYDEMQAEFACVSLATSETSQEEAL